MRLSTLAGRFVAHYLAAGAMLHSATNITHDRQTDRMLVDVRDILCTTSSTEIA